MAVTIGGSIGGIVNTSGNVVEENSASGNVSTSTLRSSGTVTEQSQMSGRILEPSTLYITELYFDTYANFPEVGESDYLYIATDSNTMYRWNDSYICVSDKNFTYRQQIASAVWVIEHNLHKYPAVIVKDSSGNLQVGEIDYDSENQITLRFSAAFAGRAYLN